MENEIKELVSDITILGLKEKFDKESWENEIKTLILREETKIYINFLLKKAKPETALREAFFAGDSIFKRNIFRELIPEQNVEGNGFIDYSFEVNERPFFLELKTFFVRDRNRLVQSKLKWTSKLRQKQLRRYLIENEYLFLTNLHEWVIFSNKSVFDKGGIKPFWKGNLSDFYDNFKKYGDLRDMVKRLEQKVKKQALDKSFFKSLDFWVKTLDDIEFIDFDKKDELILGLINKFVFIQILSDFGIIPFNRIRTLWNRYWEDYSDRYKIFLTELMNQVNTWFFTYYDTNLFQIQEVEHLKESDANYKLFTEKLKKVLGFEDYNTGEIKGIIQFNYEEIDEDILGKAYEIYLANKRNEKGIFYTKKYVTKYISEKVIYSLFDPLILEFKDHLIDQKLDEALLVCQKISKLKILDPACGSGSFLIKALRVIFRKYVELFEIFDNNVSFLLENKSKKETITDFNSVEITNRLDKISNVIKKKSPKWQILATICIRHLFGIDLDPRAVEICKLNLWLESIKLSPLDFNYQKIPKKTNNILPNLKLNVLCGDSIIQISDSFIGEFIANNRDLMNELSLERNSVFEDPLNPERINDIYKRFLKIQDRLWESFISQENRNEADTLLLKIATDQKNSFKFSYVVAFRWKFDGIIGNPPYVSIEDIPKSEREYFKERYPTCYYRLDYFAIFTELISRILKHEGHWSFILKSAIANLDSYYRLRFYLLTNHLIDEIIKMPDTSFEDASVETLIIKTTYKPQFDVKDLLTNSSFLKQLNIRKTILEDPTLIIPHPDSNNWETRIIIFPAKINMDTMDFTQAIKQLTVSQNQWLNEPLFHFVLTLTVKIKNMLDHMDKIGVPLNDIIHMSQGVTAYDKYSNQNKKQIQAVSVRKRKEQIEKGVKQLRPYHLSKATTESAMKLLYGSDVSRFLVQWNEEGETPWLNYGDWLAAPRDPKFFKEPHLLIREILTGRFFLRIYAAYTEKEFVNGHDILNGVFQDSMNSKADKSGLEYYVGILNSLLFTFYHREKYLDVTKKTQQTIQVGQVNHFPIVSDFKTRDIEKTSKDLIKLYKDKLAWDLAIKEMGIQLKPEMRSLTYLENQSLKKRQDGNFDEAWFKSVVWKVNAKSYELTSNFQAYVELKTISSSYILILYFFSKDDPKVIPIVELEMKDKTLATITFISLHDLRYPRNESLESFIKDIEIFTLKPDIWEKSKNIYAYLKNYLETELGKKIKDFPDLINEILNKECLLEALVVKNYNIESIVPIPEFLDMFPLNEIIKNKITKLINKSKN